MSYLKKFRRYFLLFALSFFCVLIIGYFTPTKWCNFGRENCPFTICVSNTGIHTNILVPVKNELFDWETYLRIDDLENNIISAYNYLSFGWGDRAFYLATPSWAELNFVTTFNALFLPTASVMYVQGHLAIPDIDKIKCVSLTQQDYLNLMNFMKDSFQFNARSQAIRIRQGYSANSAFYEAKGSYSIVRNCNSWTAEALRRANINTPRWAALSSAIMFHLKSSCECRH